MAGCLGRKSDQLCGSSGEDLCGNDKILCVEAGADTFQHCHDEGDSSDAIARIKSILLLPSDTVPPDKLLYAEAEADTSQVCRVEGNSSGADVCIKG